MKKQTKVQICGECETGRVLPSYKRGKKPTFTCNHCKADYTPKDRSVEGKVQQTVTSWIRGAPLQTTNTTDDCLRMGVLDSLLHIQETK